MPMSDSVLLQILPFVVLFLVHQFVLATWLRGKRWPYLVATLLLLGLFACWCFFLKERPSPPGMPHGQEPPPQWAPAPPPEGAPEKEPRPIRPEWQEFFMGILIIAGSQGLLAIRQVKRNERKMQELKAESLSRQLESLRYQINPHFFMNTLNNIHALVDIDPEQAKETIVELSKMMRYVLYEGNKQCVPLGSELSFIRHYVSLMQLRYTDKVRITLDLPAEVPELQVPPLLLITFIENAFKHGVSYQKPSFIDIKVALQNRQLFFTCLNSKVDGAQKKNNGPCTTADAKQGGVGLANVRKRLELLFAGRYTFEIDETAETYHVKLQFPLTTEPLIHPQS